MNSERCSAWRPRAQVRRENSGNQCRSLVGKDNAWFGQKIFDIPEAHAEIDPDGVTDDYRREAVPLITRATCFTALKALELRRDFPDLYNLLVTDSLFSVDDEESRYLRNLVGHELLNFDSFLKQTSMLESSANALVPASRVLSAG